MLSNVSANQGAGFSGGEIAAFDPFTDRLFVTSGGYAGTELSYVGNAGSVFQVNIFDYSNPSSPAALGTIDFTTAFGGSALNMLSLSSVAVDPLGRGFGAAALIPIANTTTQGKVGFFNLTTGAVIGTVDVGYHPDSLLFSADGTKLISVNEGEFNPTVGTNGAGSISILDISGITGATLANLPSVSVGTYDFSSGNLASGVSISGIRNSNVSAVGTSGTFISAVPDFTLPANIDPNAIEPEYAAYHNGKIIVTLQDNNAMAVFDTNAGPDQNKWTSVTSLGTITQLVDASDQDGGTNINDSVKGMPMPDAVAVFGSSGSTYAVTANEGDARVDDRDISRFGDTGGNDSMNPILDLGVVPNTATGVRANDTGLGRLNVSRLNGDTDADGKIEEPVMLGTRSVSIWNITSGSPVLVWDSGSAFEDYIRLNDATGYVDGRSDDKGPEPEAVTVGTFEGRTYLFAAMERTASLFVYDVTDPLNPSLFDYERISSGTIPLRPESLSFISDANSPTGTPLLIVGYEGDGTASSERVVAFSFVPEPSSALLLIASATVLLSRRHRRAA